MCTRTRTRTRTTHKLLWHGAYECADRLALVLKHAVIVVDLWEVAEISAGSNAHTEAAATSGDTAFAYHVDG